MATPAPLPIGSTLPDPVARRGIKEYEWRTLMNSLYPGAKGESVLLVWDYCKARQLDPLKKPCHIVPMDVKVGDRYEKRDVVMPGIYELRTTAQRTGQYLGHAKPEYGPVVDCAGVKAPEWCDFTAYRWNAEAKQRAEFPVRTLFREVVATSRDGKANARWSKAPVQMLTKCAEAAGLREAFPDELGGEQTAEEMDGQRAIDVTPAPAKPDPPKPDQFDDWLLDLQAVADEGSAHLADAWKNAPQATREYLTLWSPEVWDGLKVRAVAADAAKKPEPAA
jgi:phage recombination protein Bet